MIVRTIGKLRLVPEELKKEQYQQLKLFRLLEMKKDLLRIAEDLRLTKAKLRLRLIQNEQHQETSTKIIPDST